MKKIIICALIMLQINIVYAIQNNVETSSLSFYCNTEIKEYLGEEELYADYTFAHGKKINNITKKNAQPILMINGLYKPDIKVITKNNQLLVPINILDEFLDLNVTYKVKNDEITIKKNDLIIYLKINESFAFVDNNQYTLAKYPLLINGKIHIPLRFICENLGWQVNYYSASEIDLFYWNPLVTIDCKSKNIPISKECAYECLKNNLQYAYHNFIKNYQPLNTDKDYITESFNMIKEDISNLKFSKIISRYYVFEGLLYNIYVDQYTGATYFNIKGIGFSEVKKVNFDDPKLFEYGYIVD
ncbi:MAG: copper amine oxidase N-terminal domain-containing protein [Marinisporobacter sp.]|jgi:hypothetical protein|nr:copper amine oxidase N-terminal domain-containing protein [Marinisporobacter sp.]